MPRLREAAVVGGADARKPREASARRALQAEQSGGIEIGDTRRGGIGIDVPLDAGAQVQQQGRSDGLVVVDARVDARDVQRAADGDGIGEAVLPDVLVGDLVGEVAGDAAGRVYVVIDLEGRQVLNLMEGVTQLVVVDDAVRIGGQRDVAQDLESYRDRAG